MNLREISETSIAVSIIKYLYKWHNSLSQRVKYVYHNSQTYILSKEFWDKTKICFRYSFLGRITETRITAPTALDNSQIVQFLINLYKRWKDKIIHYSRTSFVTELAKDTKKILYFSPMQIISVIVVIAIAVDVSLSIILKKQISLWGYLMRGLFLFVAVSGLFCKAEWSTVKRSSVFLRKI